MTKQKKKNNLRLIAVFVLIAAAYFCRIKGMLGIHSKELGLIRSCIYLFLFAAWGFSVRNRIIQVQARRYLTAIASLMVFWFLVRTLKFHYLSTDLFPNVARYLWYMYYLPMLFIPLFAVFVAVSIGRPENYRIPKRTAMLGIPTAVLFLLVMTNDLHQLVFEFSSESSVWDDDDYSYAVGYYLVVAWLFICALIILTELYRKRRVASSRRLILLPCIPIVTLILYTVLNFLYVEWLCYFAGDTTAVFCLLYAATLEICIHCGFIQANTHYNELFDASTVGAQITDEEYNVCLSSKAAKPVDIELLRQTEKGPVMLDGGIRLSGAPIHGGHVVWTEDISPLIKVLYELNEVKENLEDSNDILEEENAVRSREAHIAEQDRLYNIIQRDTARQICLMDELINKVELTDTDESKIKLLQKMLVIGAYLKRRSNLVFLADKTSVTPAKELELTFGESIDNLEMYGVTCGFYSELSEPIPAAVIMSMYDLFEDIIERSLDCMNCLTVHFGKKDGCILFTVNTDSSADLSFLSSETVTAECDEDGEWKITLRRDIGGDCE